MWPQIVALFGCLGPVPWPKTTNNALRLKSSKFAHHLARPDQTRPGPTWLDRKCSLRCLKSKTNSVNKSEKKRINERLLPVPTALHNFSIKTQIKSNNRPTEWEKINKKLRKSEQPAGDGSRGKGQRTGYRGNNTTTGSGHKMGRNRFIFLTFRKRCKHRRGGGGGSGWRLDTCAH